MLLQFVRFLILHCAAAMHVFGFAVSLVEFFSLSGVWRFLMCSFAAADARCLVVGHYVCL
jgi:hypothetical protein